MYLLKSSTTATLQHCPARLVPAPRGKTGAPYFLHAATVAITSWSSRGKTSPMGICREVEPSVAYSARLPRSNRTSPRTVRFSSLSSSNAGEKESTSFACELGGSGVSWCDIIFADRSIRLGSLVGREKQYRQASLPFQ